MLSGTNLNMNCKHYFIDIKEKDNIFQHFFGSLLNKVVFSFGLFFLKLFKLSQHTNLKKYTFKTFFNLSR